MALQFFQSGQDLPREGFANAFQLGQILNCLDVCNRELLVLDQQLVDPFADVQLQDLREIWLLRALWRLLASLNNLF